MSRRTRVSVAVLAGLLGFAAQAAAQIPGMPLFTNPRYGTGLRVHADVGQPTQSGTNLTDRTVVQGGVSLALGPIGLGVNVGTNFNRANDIASGNQYNLSDNFTASAIAQLRVLGGGRNNLSLSVFGGGSVDITGSEIAAGSQNIQYPKFANFPVGAALGYRIPLGLASLNVWGAGRYVFSKYVNCPATDPMVGGISIFPGISHLCDATEKNVRWSVGADLPILRIFSIRAAYDSGKIGTQKVDYWGIGASIGIGGMR
jgi:hypothetical protein